MPPQLSPFATLVVALMVSFATSASAQEKNEVKKAAAAKGAKKSKS